MLGAAIFSFEFTPALAPFATTAGLSACQSSVPGAGLAQRPSPAYSPAAIATSPSAVVLAAAASAICAAAWLLLPALLLLQEQGARDEVRVQGSFRRILLKSLKRALEN